MALRSLAAAARIAVLGIPSRLAMSLSAVLSIALAVLVLLGFLSMGAGFRAASQSGGSRDVAVVLADGASSEMNSVIDVAQFAPFETAPEIARGAAGPVLSYEAHAIVSALRDGGDEANVTLRGMDSQGLAVRPQARLVRGRMFAPGTNELVVGREIAAGFRDLKLERSIRLAGVSWKVVGEFEAGGALMESEAWADRQLVSQFFGAGSPVQSIRLRLSTPEALAPLQRRIQEAGGQKLSVRSEKDYFASQAHGTGSLILYIGWPLGIAMALGALAGALNTMFTSVSTRTAEIATLRTLGFSGSAMFLSTMAEALLLVLAGAALALLIARLLFDGMSASTIGSNLTQVMFKLELTRGIAVQALLMAVVVGLVGGIPPSWRAARQPIVKAAA